MRNANTLLKRAGPDDLAPLLDLVRAFCEQDRHAFDHERVTTALLPLLHDDRHGLVWTIGEPAQGYAVVTWGYSLESGGRDALLDEIYVSEQRQGLGSRAVHAIFAELEARDIRRIFLETEAHNAGVRAFYSRLGFKTEDSIWMTRESPPDA